MEIGLYDLFWRLKFRLANPLSVLNLFKGASFTVAIEATYSKLKCCKITVFQNLLMALPEIFKGHALCCLSLKN